MKTKVTSIEYWDFFNEQFDMELANTKGYADYDIVYKRTKEYVDNQIEIA
tara:strand:- start:2395 stop:2544 length:150 start_codon:yes stop_codon:yes gene_type:complete